MLRHGSRMVVNHALEPVKLCIDRAQIRTRSIEHGAVALAATYGRQQHFLSSRRSSRHIESPFSGLVRGRQRIEVSDKIGDFLVADLRLDERGHNSPRLADGLSELRDRQLAAGEIRAEGALTFTAMTVFALRGWPFPQCLTRLGVAGRRSRATLD